MTKSILGRKGLFQSVVVVPQEGKSGATGQSRQELTQRSQVAGLLLMACFLISPGPLAQGGTTHSGLHLPHQS